MGHVLIMRPYVLRTVVGLAQLVEQWGYNTMGPRDRFTLGTLHFSDIKYNVLSHL
jgi:hypothetical protein